MKFPLKLYVLTLQDSKDFRFLCANYKKSASVRFFKISKSILEEIEKCPFRTLPRSVIIDLETIPEWQLQQLLDGFKLFFHTFRAMEIPFRIFLVGKYKNSDLKRGPETQWITGWEEVLVSERLIEQALA